MLTETEGYGRPLALCRAVAGRDMEGVRIYVVPQSLLPDDLGGRSVCGGYTASRLDLHLRDHIPGYKGRGACMVINDECLQSHLEGHRGNAADFDGYYRELLKLGDC